MAVFHCPSGSFSISAADRAWMRQKVVVYAAGRSSGQARGGSMAARKSTQRLGRKRHGLSALYAARLMSFFDQPLTRDVVTRSRAISAWSVTSMATMLHRRAHNRRSMIMVILFAGPWCLPLTMPCIFL